MGPYRPYFSKMSWLVIGGEIFGKSSESVGMGSGIVGKARGKKRGEGWVGEGKKERGRGGWGKDKKNQGGVGWVMTSSKKKKLKN